MSDVALFARPKPPPYPKPPRPPPEPPRPQPAQSVPARHSRKALGLGRRSIAPLHRKPPPILATVTRPPSSLVLADPQRAVIGNRGTAGIFPVALPDAVVFEDGLRFDHREALALAPECALLRRESLDERRHDRQNFLQRRRQCAPRIGGGRPGGERLDPQGAL